MAVTYLSQEWLDAVLDAMRSSAQARTAAAELEVTIQHVITGIPDGEAAYWIGYARGEFTGGIGRAPAFDVTLTRDIATSVAIDRGEMVAQAAYMQGHLEIAGDMMKFLEHQRVSEDLVAAARTVETTYDTPGRAAPT